MFSKYFNRKWTIFESALPQPKFSSIVDNITWFFTSCHLITTNIFACLLFLKTYCFYVLSGLMLRFGGLFHASLHTGRQTFIIPGWILQRKHGRNAIAVLTNTSLVCFPNIHVCFLSKVKITKFYIKHIMYNML